MSGIVIGNKWRFDPVALDLQLFAEGGDGAAASPSGGSGAEENSAVVPGVLDDGTTVDQRLADRMNKLGVKAQKRAGGAADRGQGNVQTQPKTPDEEWAELKKGKYADQYGKDVQAAIQARFKNQQDANAQLDKLKPMLNALSKKNGIAEGDLDALSKKILDDDSLYEDEAEKHGMTVEAYKQFTQLQQEHEDNQKRQAEQAQQELFNRHIANLVQQEQVMKQKYPGFDLRTELKNDQFRRMTSPEGGLSVESAYFAIHHDELMPQAMAYGMNRARQQVSQSIQANQSRPTEGANNNSAAVNVSIDPRNLSRDERRKLNERARMGERIVL